MFPFHTFVLQLIISNVLSKKKKINDYINNYMRNFSKFSFLSLQKNFQRKKPYISKLPKYIQ